MCNVRPELAETDEAAAGGMDDRMVRLERLVENLSSEIVKLARPPPSQASSAPGTSVQQEKMKFLVIGTKTSVEVYAWAQKP
eukprot:Em0005g616a